MSTFTRCGLCDEYGKPGESHHCPYVRDMADDDTAEVTFAAVGREQLWLCGGCGQAHHLWGEHTCIDTADGSFKPFGVRKVQVYAPPARPYGPDPAPLPSVPPPASEATTVCCRCSDETAGGRLCQGCARHVFATYVTWCVSGLQSTEDVPLHVEITCDLPGGNNHRFNFDRGAP